MRAILCLALLACSPSAGHPHAPGPHDCPPDVASCSDGACCETMALCCPN